VKVTVLGSHGTWPRAGGAASGYLLSHEGFHVWVDAGTGTLAKLQEHVDPFEVGAVIVSHRHFDHFLDLYPYFFARWSEGHGTVPLYAPPGMFEHAMQIEDGLALAFDAHAVEPGGSFEVGPFRVRTRAMRHPVPTLGMRFTANGSSLAYSADTGPTEELVAIARDADVLLSEATFMGPDNPAPDFHLTAAEAGEHAARAAAGRTILTHIRPLNDRDDVFEQASAAYDGDLVLAEEGLEVAP
jgi:ribonuclease BN (tRNA processing enzyme)